MSGKLKQRIDKQVESAPQKLADFRKRQEASINAIEEQAARDREVSQTQSLQDEAKKKAIWATYGEE